MPATADLNRVFQSAEGQREKSDHKRIEPSHLLAAVLEGTSRPELDLLRSAGITEESVRAKLEELYGNS
jgi:ATP-dependent Clp protease ATP-binding subunit ClpA